MNKTTPKVTILSEDITHDRFIRKYLICRGFDERDIRCYPATKGNKIENNNAFVLENYPKIVNSYRIKKNAQNLAVIVMIDSDGKSLDQILRNFNIALDQELGKLNNDLRQEGEKIAIFIPARNIETWFYYIEQWSDHIEKKQNFNENFDEDENYKKSKYKNLSNDERVDLATLSAKKLAEQCCPQGLPKNAPISLRHACRELQRLEI